MAGGAGEWKAARLIADDLESSSVSAMSMTKFEIPGWWCGSSSLTAAYTNREHRFEADREVIALPGTPRCNITAELVDGGYGRPEDFESNACDGKIVMASSETPDDYGRWTHRGDKYGCRGKTHGARAFVFKNHIEGTLPPTGGVGEENGPGNIPAVGVSKEVGARLERYWRIESVEGTVEIDCRNEPTFSQNVEGVLGPETTEEILLVSHVNGHDISEAARDNGAGVAFSSASKRCSSALVIEYSGPRPKRAFVTWWLIVSCPAVRRCCRF